MRALPAPSLRHLAWLTDDVGIVEHARLTKPRRDLGYCTDDAGRLLALACHLPQDPDARRLATVALGFLGRAQEPGGGFRLRLHVGGRWAEERQSDDATGRALYGLGVAVASAPWSDVRDSAQMVFDRAVGFRSPHPRATAYAAIGAGAVLHTAPGSATARDLVNDAASSLPRPLDDPAWPWPEPRLTYANAVLPEALLVVAHARGDDGAQRQALQLLAWLVEVETNQTWFSFTPVGGRGPGESRPGFDQQPIEAWAMADACARAFELTGDPKWVDVVDRTARWFAGDNDTKVEMFDPAAGGFDGLEPKGVNGNQGAESTMAFVATMAQAWRLGPVQSAVSRTAAVRASRR